MKDEEDAVKNELHTSSTCCKPIHQKRRIHRFTCTMKQFAHKQRTVWKSAWRSFRGICPGKQDPKQTFGPTNIGNDINAVGEEDPTSKMNLYEESNKFNRIKLSGILCRKDNIKRSNACQYA